MIVVAGLNSAIDKLIDVETFEPGRIARAQQTREWPGGKGAHVAMCAAALDEPVRLVGFIDARHHDEFSASLRARGVEFHGIEIRGPIRTCLTIRERDGRVTEIRESGPEADAQVWETARNQVAALCGDADVAVLSGSVPPRIPPSAYGDLIAELSGVRVLVDASGDLVRCAIKARPFCVKTNRDEAEELTGLQLDSAAAAARAVSVLASKGVQLAIISMAALGAIACHERRLWVMTPPTVTPRNAVGAGDCLSAGIAVGLARGYDLTDTLRLGVACGTAKVLSPETGLVHREDIDKILPTVSLQA